MALSREDVLACLKAIKAPSGTDLVEAGLVRALNVDGDTVRFVMEVDLPDPFMEAKAEAEAKLAALGKTAAQSDLAEMDALWDAVKADEKAKN